MAYKDSRISLDTLMVLYPRSKIRSTRWNLSHCHNNSTSKLDAVLQLQFLHGRTQCKTIRQLSQAFKVYHVIRHQHKLKRMYVTFRRIITSTTLKCMFKLNFNLEIIDHKAIFLSWAYYHNGIVCVCEPSFLLGLKPIHYQKTTCYQLLQEWTEQSITTLS